MFDFCESVHELGLSGGNVSPRLGRGGYVSDPISGKVEGRMKTLSKMTVDELKQVVEAAVEDKLYEIIGDPDQGLELRQETKKRLLRSLRNEKRGKPGIPAHKVTKQLGASW